MLRLIKYKDGIYAGNMAEKDGKPVPGKKVEDVSNDFKNVVIEFINGHTVFQHHGKLYKLTCQEINVDE
jgi:hypothetical protein